ncbi:MAG: HAMP domain-containing protein [Clostridia bacterium]|nr:HAMP domain-containing protein [Clostridia bacterium]
MKNRPLSAQLWIAVSILISIVLLMIFGIMNLSVRTFFEKQTFETIEFSQANRLKHAQQLDSEAMASALDSIDISDDTVSQSAQEYERSVNHILLTKKRLNSEVRIMAYKLPIVREIRSTILAQEETTKRYIFQTDQHIYAVVTKVEMRGEDVFMISYMQETYTKGLIRAMNKHLISVLIFSLIFSLVLAQFIARRITKPLEALENQLGHIAHKEWQEELLLDRNDEIGRLAASANIMQQRLKEQDREEKDFIQTVSHDLKTPIMVIRSYAQAVLDGVIAPEDIKSSIQLIDTEALKMNEKIRSLIYLYTLRNQADAFDEYLEIQSLDYLENLIKRFQYTTDKLVFQTRLDDIPLSINEMTFTVALENIIENALRFAKNLIQIECHATGSHVMITVFNDGTPLRDPERIFERYETEAKGNTGLGLAITKEIIRHHRGEIKAQNEKDGVSFIITLPKLL